MDRLALVRAIASAWLVAALISAAIGLIQYFGASTAFAPWVSGTELGDAYGNLRQRNQFATLMAIGMAALAWWVVQGGSLRLAVVAATLLALGSAASSSRTGLLQWVLFIGFAAQWRGDRRTALRVVLLVAALVYTVATAGLPWLAGLDPLNSGAWARLRAGDAACMGRLTLWSNVLHLIAQKPWFGWGWGELDYAHFVALYPGARFCDILDNAHNLPLHLAVELGLPIAIAVCGFGLWMVLHAKPWRESDPTRQMAWAVLALLALHSLLEYPLWYGPFQIAAGLSVWLLFWPEGATQSWTAKEHFRPIARVFIASTATVLIAICGYTAWDYWRISQLYVAHAERTSTYRDNTLEKLQVSWLFKSQVQFAELTTMALAPSNAAHAFDLASELLHFSPEPRVAEKLIESAVILGRDEDAAFYMARYRAAFPEAYALWAASSTRYKAP
jgi:O-antigen ligase